jgi:hypothetical protein
MDVMIDGIRYIPEPPRPIGDDVSAALSVVFDSDAGDGITVRGYLHALLETLFEQEEGFSGKRPFGNSGWTNDIPYALAKAGIIDMGELDEYGRPWNPTEEQREAADQFVFKLIQAIFFGHGADTTKDQTDVR